jgi:succinylglutamate desuccinylase
MLGTYGGHSDGPLVICLGGIHGNEPAGVVAAQRVLQWLSTNRPAFRGELVALSGNRGALLCRCRYVAHDLNRLWSDERVAALRQGTATHFTSPEDIEQRELLMAIDEALARRRGPVIFLDLHTTSATGLPFAVIADTLLNRHFARNLPVPVILGLEEHLDNTTLNYMNDCGYIAIGFEGGQNESAEAIDNNEAALWTTLITAGCLQQQDVPQIRALCERLVQQTRSVPPILEIRYRHAISPGTTFSMEPGFTNFQPINRHQLLARDDRGEIRATEDGHILMPLYQSQGTDGFFLVRAVRPFWLTVSAWLRQLRLERLLPWLPGIKRHPERSETLIVNPRLARWFVTEIFHLLGFRRQRTENGLLLVSRRPHDVRSLAEWDNYAKLSL